MAEKNYKILTDVKELAFCREIEYEDFMKTYRYGFRVPPAMRDDWLEKFTLAWNKCTYSNPAPFSSNKVKG